MESFCRIPDSLCGRLCPRPSACFKRRPREVVLFYTSVLQMPVFAPNFFHNTLLLFSCHSHITYNNIILGFPRSSSVKKLPAIQEARVQFLGQEDPLEKGMATHCSILAWRIAWTEVSGRLQSFHSQTPLSN